MPEERIVLLPRSENFWQAGPTGPCGPCSEMYLDRGEEFGGPDDRPGDDTDRFVEYWNHVFMSYDLRDDGSLAPLPANNVDTGMGLERMAAILQDVPSVFETDLFRPLIELAEELSGKPYDDELEDHAGDADHRRPLARDGQPDRRRRRAVERGARLRAASDHAARDPAGQGARARAALPGAVRRAGDRTLADVYPHLEAERETVMRWVRDEEQSFGRTLERGTELLGRLIEDAKRAQTSWIDAEDAFRLHDTYGFPYDLTKELLADEGLAVDDEGFEALMEQQRARARTAALERRVDDRHQAGDLIRQRGPADQLRRLRVARGTRPASPRRRRWTATAPDFWSSSRTARSTRRAVARSPISGVIATNGSQARVEDVYRVGDDQAIRVADGEWRAESGERVEARSSTTRPAHATMRTTPLRIFCTRRCGSGWAPTSARRGRR